MAVARSLLESFKSIVRSSQHSLQEVIEVLQPGPLQVRRWSGWLCCTAPLLLLELLQAGAS